MNGSVLARYERLSSHGYFRLFSRIRINTTLCAPRDSRSFQHFPRAQRQENTKRFDRVKKDKLTLQSFVGLSRAAKNELGLLQDAIRDTYKPIDSIVLRHDKVKPSEKAAFVRSVPLSPIETSLPSLSTDLTAQKRSGQERPPPTWRTESTLESESTSTREKASYSSASNNESTFLKEAEPILRGAASSSNLLTQTGRTLHKKQIYDWETELEFISESSSVREKARGWKEYQSARKSLRSPEVEHKPKQSAASAWRKHQSASEIFWEPSKTRSPEGTAGSRENTMAEKRQANGSSGHPRKKIKLTKRNKGGGQGSIDGIPWPDGSNDEILKLEVQELINDPVTENGAEASIESELPALLSKIELKVVKISSTGDGLALSDDGKHVYAIPFSIPGDTVMARPYLRVLEDSFSRADFISMVQPSPQRDDSLVQCQYFSKCGGCQFQMMLPEDQLAHKKKVLQDAFQHFSGIDPSLLPEVEDTLPSPIQYNYRTKLTPHFDGPPGFARRNKDGRIPRFTEVPPIGFMIKGRRQTIDIEDCPIGSEAVRFGLKKEKQRVIDTIDTFTKGATILLRETTERRVKAAGITKDSFKQPVVRETEEYFEVKDYVTNNNATVKEYVGDSLLINNANSFFQNNNAILPSFIEYVKERLFSKSAHVPKAKYFVDAYCGSGLFTIKLAPFFEKSIGVDIDPASIDFAKQNALHNDLKSKASFLTATASDIFGHIGFPALETVIVIDPPRKGCDLPFLRQLLRFGPQRIVYVSCNVHSQARDIGFMVNGIPKVDAGFGESEGAYTVESLRGCDFFPQTAHVEGIAVLQRKASTEPETAATTAT